MAVNVTQKDKTLNDVIEWCEKHVARIDEKIPNASDEGFLTGERFALQRRRSLRGTVGIFGFHAVGSAKSERESKPLMLPEDTTQLVANAIRDNY